MTRTPNSAQNENGIFGISASRGFRKIIICHTFGETKFCSFSMLKKLFGAVGTRVHNNRMIPPNPPFQFCGALLTNTPPPKTKTRPPKTWPLLNQSNTPAPCLDRAVSCAAVQTPSLGSSPSTNSKQCLGCNSNDGCRPPSTNITNAPSGAHTRHGGECWGGGGTPVPFVVLSRVGAGSC